MKAIIIAAGMSSRLRPITNDRPKCLIEIKGRSLLDYQLDALRASGITEIVLVKGYQKEKINYPDLRYYINDNYQNNNILNSLFCAEPEMNDELIAVYSDILYNKTVVATLLESQEDISIVVDIKWQDYYKGRTKHPKKEAEKVIFDANNKVIEIGKILNHKDEVGEEFIGMMKCSKRGVEIFKRNFHRAKRLFWGKPFQCAETFEKAYLTDLIQEMVELGVKVHCVFIERGWIEIDTLQDYQRAEKMIINDKNLTI